MSYVPPSIALISLSRLSTWKTNSGDRESQTGCDLQICDLQISHIEVCKYD